MPADHSLSSRIRSWLLDPVHDHIQRLENRIMASFDDVLADLNSVTDSVAARVEALLTALDNSDAALDAQTQAHVDALRPAVEKLRAIGADSDNPVPDAEPLPEPTPVEGGDTSTPVDTPVEEA